MPVTLADTNAFPVVEGIADGEPLDAAHLNGAASSLTKRTRWLKDCWQTVQHGAVKFTTSANIFTTSGAPFGDPDNNYQLATATTIIIPAQDSDLLVLEASIHLAGVSVGSQVAFFVDGVKLPETVRQGPTSGVFAVHLQAVVIVTGALANRTVRLGIVPWGSSEATLKGPGIVRAYVLRSGGNT